MLLWLDRYPLFYEGSMKSHVRILLEVVTNILMDVSNKCTADTFDPRDLITVRSRLEHEGLSFLTITLPSLGRDFERSLAEGGISPNLFRSFKKRGRIPAFLQGIFGCVFDRTTGRLLHDPSIEAIEGIRQVAYTFKKLLVDCAHSRVQETIDGYVQCEQELKEPLDPEDIADFLAVSRALWSTHFSVDMLDTGRPKHGPGATCERISGNQKFNHRTWHERLEPYFPLLDVAFSVNAALEEEFEAVTFVSEEQESPVRVITVPKTLKGPRVIAIEPVCMQYTQQMLSREIVRSLQTHPLTGGQINFSDQSVNGNLAMTSSQTEGFATLDLSSASDRVPYSLAIRMFDSCPEFRDAISACRSKRAKLPDGRILDLEKFASMGSALCFPVESMYFYTICTLALLKKHELPVTKRNLYKVASSVFVYGDDIIVPTDAAVVVMSYLAKFYCKVNTDKSFWTGKFRESCGVDAYDGELVTPTYLRTVPPHDKRSSRELVSWVATSNLFHKRGYWRTAHYLKTKVEKILGSLPVISETSPAMGLVSFMGYPDYRRRGRYQRPEVRAWVPRPIYRSDRLTGYGALTKCLLSLESRSNETFTMKDHLSRTARSGVVTLKRQWAPAA